MSACGFVQIVSGVSAGIALLSAALAWGAILRTNRTKKAYEFAKAAYERKLYQLGVKDA